MSKSCIRPYCNLSITRRAFSHSPARLRASLVVLLERDDANARAHGGAIKYRDIVLCVYTVGAIASGKFFGSAYFSAFVLGRNSSARLCVCVCDVFFFGLVSFCRVFRRAKRIGRLCMHGSSIAEGKKLFYGYGRPRRGACLSVRTLQFVIFLSGFLIYIYIFFSMNFSSLKLYSKVYLYDLLF